MFKSSIREKFKEIRFGQISDRLYFSLDEVVGNYPTYTRKYHLYGEFFEIFLMLISEIISRSDEILEGILDEYLKFCRMAPYNVD